MECEEPLPKHLLQPPLQLLAYGNLRHHIKDTLPLPQALQRQRNINLSLTASCYPPQEHRFPGSRCKTPLNLIKSRLLYSRQLWNILLLRHISLLLHCLKEILHLLAGLDTLLPYLHRRIGSLVHLTHGTHIILGNLLPQFHLLLEHRRKLLNSQDWLVVYLLPVGSM